MKKYTPLMFLLLAMMSFNLFADTNNELISLHIVCENAGEGCKEIRMVDSEFKKWVESEPELIFTRENVKSAKLSLIHI